jgi:hypothetical protein
MPDERQNIQQLPETYEGSLVGPSIRPVPFTCADGSDGAELYLDLEGFHATFAADVDRATADVMAATQRPVERCRVRRTVRAAGPEGRNPVLVPDRH